MSQENVHLVRAAWEAWDRRDMDALFALYDQAIVLDATRLEVPDLAAEYRGHDGVRRFVRAWLEPFESYYARPEEFIEAGEAVVVRMRQGGRSKESGAEVEMPPYWQVYRVENGLIVRIEVYLASEALKAAVLEEE